jgi:hypothetical protein
MSNLLRRFTSQGNESGARSVSGGAVGGASVADSDVRFGGSTSIRDESASRPGSNSKSLSQTISFSDFSMHVMDEEEHAGYASHAKHTSTGLPSPPRIATRPVAIPGGKDHDEHGGGRASLDEELSNLKIHTKAAGNGAPASPISKSLGIPSVASIFGTPKVGLAGAGETPRSSLDLYDTTISSAPTPTRRSADGEESAPVSPRSPKTPGGRRRKQRINGLDSFEWLELVRGSSL